LWISSWNAIVYCVIVAIPTIVDPLHARPPYGDPNYPWGWLVLVPAVLVFGITYLVTNFAERKYTGNATTIALISVSSLIVISYLTLFNFGPYHNQILFGPLAFGFVIVSGIYIHYYNVDVNYLEEHGIDPLNRIERLKLEHEAWFRILLYLSSLYVLAAISISVYLIDRSLLFTSSPEERGYVLTGYWVMIMLNFITFLVYPGLELIRKAAYIRNLVTKVHS
jgi:hypothetical protein